MHNIHDVACFARLALCAHASGSTLVQLKTTAWVMKTAEMIQ